MGEPTHPLEEWAVALAEELSPNEVDVAPALTDAFLKGGRTRDKLVRPPGVAEPGAFGVVIAPDTIVHLLVALSNVAGSIAVALTWPGTGAIVGTLRSAAMIRDKLEARKALTALPEPQAQGLSDLVERLVHELRGQGVSDDQAEVMALRTMKVLLEHPHGTQEFLTRLSPRR
jgi:hypothetical protein